MESGLKYRARKMEIPLLAMDMYNNKVRAALKHRSNVTVPVMGGFVDTLLSKIDNPPVIQYGYQDIADLRRSQKVQACWDILSGPNYQNWPLKAIAATKDAIFTDRAIFAFEPTKEGGRLRVVDPFDFIVPNMAAGEITEHDFDGEINVFIPKWKLEEGVKEGIYDAKEVTKIVSFIGESGNAEVERVRDEKKLRLKTLGLDPQIASDMDDGLGSNFLKMCLQIDGKHWYVLVDIATGIGIRCEEVKKVYGVDERPYTSWAGHYDHRNFWSKPSVHDMVHIGEAIQLSVNQVYDAVNEALWPQLIIDPERVLDQNQLNWEPRGLIEVNRQGNEPVDNFVKTFAPSTDKIAPQMVMNLVEFLKGFGGRETGVTNDAQGVADTDKVGINFRNLQQTADRFAHYDQVKNICFTQLGKKFWNGLQVAMPENFAVKLIGTKGIQWDTLVKGDVQPVRDFDITITGGASAAYHDELRKKGQTDDDTMIASNQILLSTVNPETFTEGILARNRDSEEVKRMLDKENSGDREVISVAEQAIQDIHELQALPTHDDGEVKLFFGATPAFVKHIFEAAINTVETPEERQLLMQYADMHIRIITENMITKARLLAPGVNTGPTPEQPQEKSVFGMTASGEQPPAAPMPQMA